MDPFSEEVVRPVGALGTVPITQVAEELGYPSPMELLAETQNQYCTPLVSPPIAAADDPGPTWATTDGVPPKVHILMA